MKKLTGISTMIALLLSFSLYANDGKTSANEQNKLLKEVKLESQLNEGQEKLHTEINKHIRENVKMHRYSKDFELIMVNDKIQSKYETMNYMTYRYFKYDVNFNKMSSTIFNN